MIMDMGIKVLEIVFDIDELMFVENIIDEDVVEEVIKVFFMVELELGRIIDFVFMYM